jgi:hypothetical protein
MEWESIIEETFSSVDLCMKLYRYSKYLPCYYCGAPAPSSREHAPPKMIFTEFNCDSITVPSCEKHNTQKSIGDSVILNAIMMSAYQAYNNREKLENHLTSNVITAIGHAKQDFDQVKNEVKPRDFILDPPDFLNIQIPYLQSTAFSKISDWIRQLTAALVWSIVGRNDSDMHWDEAIVWSREMIQVPGPLSFEKAKSLLKPNADRKQFYDNFPWYFGWSATPRKYPADIYSFDLCFPEEHENRQAINAGFRHRFLNDITVFYVWFNAPKKIMDALVAATTGNIFR